MRSSLDLVATTSSFKDCWSSAISSHWKSCAPVRTHRPESPFTSYSDQARRSPWHLTRKKYVSSSARPPQLFTGGAASDGTADARGFRMCFRSFAPCIEVMIATPGRSLWGVCLLKRTWKNLVCRIDQYSCLSAVSEKKGGGRRCGAGSAMKYDQAPYMHCTNLGWLV